MRIATNTAYIICWTIVLTFFAVTNPFSALAGEGGSVKGVVKTSGVKRYEALVYIDRVKGEFPPPKENPFMSQSGLVFKPHILPILKGTTVDFSNDDNVAHDIFALPGSAQRFNLGTYSTGVKRTVTFNNLGETTLLCNVHAEMLGYIITLQNPYYALTDKKGVFEIKDVPPETYQIKVWHEKLQMASQEVVVEKGKAVSVEFKKKGLKNR